MTGTRIKVLVTLLFMFAISVCAQKRTVAYRTVATGNGTMDLLAYLYEEVDEPPHFPGGDSELTRFINTERNYPREAYLEKIEGRVLCSFIVDEEGKIDHVEVLRGVEESLNREAVRIISKMPHWIPGAINSEKVPVYCILAIPFRL